MKVKKRLAEGDRVIHPGTKMAGTVILASSANVTIKWDDNNLSTGKQSLTWMLNKIEPKESNHEESNPA
jgi:hypothetical protein